MNNKQLDMVLDYLNEGTEIDIDEYLNEECEDVLKRPDITEIKEIIKNKYKKEINDFCKSTDDKDFVVNGYRFNGIQSIDIRYHPKLKTYFMDFNRNFYKDFKKAYNKIAKMLIDKISKDDVLKKYSFTYNASKGLIYFEPK